MPLIFFFFQDFFDVDHFLKKVFIEFVTILLLCYVLVSWPQGMWDFLLLLLLYVCAFLGGRHWVFVAARGLSLVAVSGGYSSLRCAGFSLGWLLLLRSTGSRRAGSVVLRHVGSSRTRDRTRVP